MGTGWLGRWFDGMAKHHWYLILAKPAFAALRDYEAQVKQGKDPIYDARANGVHNAPNLGWNFSQIS